MLHFFPPGMLERYSLFAFVAVLGVLQLMAAHYHWIGFSLPGRQRWHWSYVLGAGLLSGAYFWFFGTVQPLIFQPGLAGAELFTVFTISTLSAIGTTLVLASLLHRSTGRPEAGGKRVEFDRDGGTIRQPADSDRSLAAIVVSDLPDGDSPLLYLVDRLTNEGYLVLNIDLSEDGSVEYPDVLARLPAACGCLRDRYHVDGQDIVLVGVGIGGDLVLRAGITAPAGGGIVAVDPVLDPEATGLDLLRHSTFWEALRWGVLRRRLVEALAATECLPRLENVPALLVYRANPMPPGEIAAVGSVEVAVVSTDDEAVQCVVGWMVNTMARREHVA